ncbi:MAG: acyltransferase domain-containing protein [Tumebacillaceae bacterium]
MASSIIFMFSGQGSQYYQMGKMYFEEDPVFRHWMLKLDRNVQEMIGDSVIEQLYDPKKRTSPAFDRMLHTNPAIFMVEYALSQVLIENGIEPTGVVGASLGEFVALALAGVMTPEQVLEALVWQAQQFEALCEPSRMLTVLHDASLYEQEPELFADAELVGVNFDAHFVIAGPTERLNEIQQALKGSRIVCHMLPVRYAFHSALIDPVKPAFLEQMQSFSFAAPNLPFYSSLYGRRIDQFPQDYFWQVARQPIRFSEAILAAERDGGAVYLDCGPSETVANFTKHYLKPNGQSSVHPVMTRFYQNKNRIQELKALLANLPAIP